jgi:hypothetical protein
VEWESNTGREYMIVNRCWVGEWIIGSAGNGMRPVRLSSPLGEDERALSLFVFDLTMGISLFF